MDPASATVAFVGFAASLASLTAVLITSSKTLYNVCKAFKDAPADIRGLSRKVERLEVLVIRMKIATDDFHNQAIQLSLKQFWTSNLVDLEDDLEQFKAQVLVLHTSLAKSSHTHGTARIRKFFADESVRKFEKNIADHMDSFHFMLNMTANAQTQSITNSIDIGLRAQSHKIDDLVSITNSFHNSRHYEMVEAHRFVRENTDLISTAVTKNFYQMTDSNFAHQRSVNTVNSLQQIRITRDSLKIQCVDQKAPYTHDLDVYSLPSSRMEGSGISTSTSAISKAYPSYHPISKPQRELGSTTVCCTVSVYNLPIGVITVQRKETHEASQNTRLGNSRSRSLDLVLFPASWIAKRMIGVSFKIRSSTDGMGFNWDLKQAVYNSDPSLVQSLRKGDLGGLQKLFAAGKAKATDLLAPFGNTLLHEAVFGFASEVPNSYQICDFLLSQGADPNVRSNTGQTALLLCSRLMNETFRFELQDLASLLVCNKADLAISDAKGFSVCSEIFQARNGLKYFESFLYKHIDLFTLQQMASADAWFVGGLARSFPTFEICLQSHLEEYRTPPAISSCFAPRSNYIKELDIVQQVIAVKEAHPVVRTGFLKALCASGTLEMVKPFLVSGIDMNELCSSHISYAGSAAKAGNIEVLRALSQAGASMRSNMTSFVTPSWGPVGELLERWFSLRIGRPEYYGTPEDEYGILKELLQTPTFWGPDTLLLALMTRQPPLVFRTLLDAGLGRRKDTRPASWELGRLGSEIILSVIENNQNLHHFLDYGLELECEDRFGYTALQHALDRGESRLPMTNLLIDAGADLFRRTRSGYTPLEFATKNLKSKHPRLLKRWNYTLRAFETCAVQEEEDRMILARLKEALREQKLTNIKHWIQAVFSLERILSLRAVDILSYPRRYPGTVLQIVLWSIGLTLGLTLWQFSRTAISV